MSPPLVVGNWKMNLDRGAAVTLAEEIAKGAESLAAASTRRTDLVVCPPCVYLSSVADRLAGSRVALGAQNVYHESAGAFTGEISIAMLRDVGCTYVILGHSERRHILGETDQDVNKKLHAALGGGLVPIVCLGELLDHRESGRTREVIQSQFDGSLAGLDQKQAAGLVIAYEPVWAIGTGRVATPEQAREVHADLRKMLLDRYNTEVAQQVRILYGGSVKPDNAEQLLGQQDVDGLLVGGASLKAVDFLAIVGACRAKK